MSQSDENHEKKAKRKVGDDIEMNEATSSTTVKPVESTTAMDTSGKSDTLDTSGGAKKPVKKKKKKTKTSPSPSPHKKAKKDPNKPEYPKVGMYCAIEPAASRIFYRFYLSSLRYRICTIYECSTR